MITSETNPFILSHAYWLAELAEVDEVLAVRSRGLLSDGGIADYQRSRAEGSDKTTQHSSYGYIGRGREARVAVSHQEHI